MLRLVFWFFLLTNGVLLAYQLGYLDSVLPQKSEPQRVAKQLNPERIRLLPPSAPTKPVAVKAPEKPAPAPPPAVEKPKQIACIQVGKFPVAKTRLVERRLAGSKLGVQPSRKNFQEPTRFMVYLPPQGGMAGVNKRVKKLRGAGIDKYFIIKNKPELRGGISLGVFSSKVSAERYRRKLRGKGIKNVQIGARKMVTKSVAYELRGMTASKMPSLKKMMARFPKQKIKPCAK